MSYGQILRRVNRLVKTAVNDVIEKLTREEQELSDFDDELRKHAQGATGTDASSRAGNSRSQEHARSRSGGSSSSSSSEGSGKRESAGGGRGASGGSGGAQQKQGARKPGEKDDAFYLAILGLPATASDDDVHRAYRRLMRQSHPDKVATLSPQLQKEATEKAMRISEAYQILRRRRGFK
jgi:DnaJ-domain-containing protein 1